MGRTIMYCPFAPFNYKKARILYAGHREVYSTFLLYPPDFLFSSGSRNEMTDAAIQKNATGPKS